MKQVVDFFKAIITYFYATKMIFTNGRLLWLTFLPFLMNIIIFIAMIYLSAVYLYPLISGLVDSASTSLYDSFIAATVNFSAAHDILFSIADVIVSAFVKFLSFAGAMITIIMLLLIFYYAYPVIGSALMFPFLDFISYEAEVIYLGRKPDVEKMSLLKIFFRAIIGSIKMLFFFLTFNLLIIIINLIPGVGTFVFIVLNFLFISFMLGLNFLDFCFERRGYSFRKKLRLAFSNFGFTCGLGMVSNLMLSIPVIGFLAFSFSSVAAAIGCNKIIFPVKK